MHVLVAGQHIGTLLEQLYCTILSLVLLANSIVLNCRGKKSIFHHNE